MAEKLKRRQGEAYYQCLACKTEIYWNTKKKYITCVCGKLSIDGCEDYVRVIGEKGDYQIVFR